MLQRYTCTNLRCICFWFVHQLKGGENYVPPLLSQGYFFFCLYLKCKSEHLPSAACLSSQVPPCPSSVLPRIIPLTVSVNDSLVVFCTTFTPVGTVQKFFSFNLHYFVWRRSLAAQANSVGSFYAWNCSPGKHRNHEVSRLIVNAWIFEAVLLPCDFSAFQCIYIYIFSFLFFGRGGGGPVATLWHCGKREHVHASVWQHDCFSSRSWKASMNECRLWMLAHTHKLLGHV